LAAAPEKVAGWAFKQLALAEARPSAKLSGKLLPWTHAERVTAKQVSPAPIGLRKPAREGNEYSVQQ
jgi:hypothetical protein